MYRVGAYRRQLAAIVALVPVLAGCAGSGPERMAVPAMLSADARIPDMDDVRVWGDAPFSKALLAPDLPKLKAKYASLAKTGKRVQVDMLALSGGADDGAFGAGLLVGWGQKGDRPEFELVTGISAGCADRAIRLCRAGTYDRAARRRFHDATVPTRSTRPTSWPAARRQRAGRQHARSSS